MQAVAVTEVQFQPSVNIIKPIRVLRFVAAGNREIPEEGREKTGTIILDGNGEHIFVNVCEDADDPFAVYLRGSMQYGIFDQGLQHQLGNDEFLQFVRNVDQKLQLVFKAQLLDKGILSDIEEILF